MRYAYRYLQPFRLSGEPTLHVPGLAPSGKGGAHDFEFREVERGEIEADSPHTAAEQLFLIHNRDNRPRGREIRSMSVGDILVIDGTAWICETVGFRPLAPQETERLMPGDA